MGIPKEEVSKEEETPKEEAPANTTEELNVEEGNATSSGNKTDAKKSKKKKKKFITVQKEKKKVHRRSLKVTAFYIGKIQPYSASLVLESRTKLLELAAKDKARMLLEEAKNKYESYIYFVKNKLSDDEDEISKVSTEEQRTSLLNFATEAEDWLYEDGYDADLETYTAKYQELAEPAEKIFFRWSEMIARPEAVLSLQSKLVKVEELMTKWKETKPQVTEEERNDVLAKVEKVKEWIKDMEEKQAELESFEDPAFNSTEVPLQTKSLETLVTKLSKKPKPKPVVKDKNTTKANDTKKEEPKKEEEKKEEETTNKEEKLEDDVGEDPEL